MTQIANNSADVENVFFAGAITANPSTIAHTQTTKRAKFRIFIELCNYSRVYVALQISDQIAFVVG